MATDIDAARVTLRQEWWRTYAAYVARMRVSERSRWVILVALVTAVVLSQFRWPDVVPSMAYGPFVILGGLFLSPTPLAFFFGYVWVCTLTGFLLAEITFGKALIACLSATLTMVAMFWVSRARADVGMVGLGSERMLSDLRRRYGELAKLPPLPDGWHAEAVVAGANGDSFAGDVLLSSEGFTARHVEFCLVDVSGKGLRAGTRAMMVASAFSGLLGQVESWRFVEAANSYLIRQRWREGFATAVHLDLDPVFGHFSVSCAGHPPVMRYETATGTWSPVTTQAGPALGIMNDVKFPRINGQLAPGDALVLYTDGVIESRSGELVDGIDWMGGMAEAAIQSGSFAGLAKHLIAAARSGPDDDRAVLIVWRRW